MSRPMVTVQPVDELGAPLGTASNPLATAPPALATAYQAFTATLGTTAGIVVALGALPNQRTVKNTDASVIAFLGGAGVTTATGFPLKPGESITFDDKVSSAALYGVCASGAPVLAVLGF